MPSRKSGRKGNRKSARRTVKVLDDDPGLSTWGRDMAAQSSSADSAQPPGASSAGPTKRQGSRTSKSRQQDAQTSTNRNSSVSRPDESTSGSQEPSSDADKAISRRDGDTGLLDASPNDAAQARSSASSAETSKQPPAREQKRSAAEKAKRSDVKDAGAAQLGAPPQPVASTSDNRGPNEPRLENAASGEQPSVSAETDIKCKPAGVAEREKSPEPAADSAEAGPDATSVSNPEDPEDTRLSVAPDSSPELSDSGCASVSLNPVPVGEDRHTPPTTTPVIATDPKPSEALERPESAHHSDTPSAAPASTSRHADEEESASSTPRPLSGDSGSESAKVVENPGEKPTQQVADVAELPDGETTALAANSQEKESVKDLTDVTEALNEGGASPTEDTSAGALASAIGGSSDAVEGTADAVEGTADAVEGTADAVEGTADAVEGTDSGADASIADTACSQIVSGVTDARIVAKPANVTAPAPSEEALATNDVTPAADSTLAPKVADETDSARATDDANATETVAAGDTTNTADNADAVNTATSSDNPSIAEPTKTLDVSSTVQAVDTTQETETDVATVATNSDDTAASVDPATTAATSGTVDDRPEQTDETVIASAQSVLSVDVPRVLDDRSARSSCAGVEREDSGSTGSRDRVPAPADCNSRGVSDTISATIAENSHESDRPCVGDPESTQTKNVSADADDASTDVASPPSSKIEGQHAESAALPAFGDSEPARTDSNATSHGASDPRFSLTTDKLKQEQRGLASPVARRHRTRYRAENQTARGGADSEPGTPSRASTAPPSPTFQSTPASPVGTSRSIRLRNYGRGAGSKDFFLAQRDTPSVIKPSPSKNGEDSTRSARAAGGSGSGASKERLGSNTPQAPQSPMVQASSAKMARNALGIGASSHSAASASPVTPHSSNPASISEGTGGLDLAMSSEMLPPAKDQSDDGSDQEGLHRGAIWNREGALPQPSIPRCTSETGTNDGTEGGSSRTGRPAASAQSSDSPSKESITPSSAPTSRAILERAVGTAQIESNIALASDGVPSPLPGISGQLSNPERRDISRAAPNSAPSSSTQPPAEDWRRSSAPNVVTSFETSGPSEIPMKGLAGLSELADRPKPCTSSSETVPAEQLDASRNEMSKSVIVGDQCSDTDDADCGNNLGSHEAGKGRNPESPLLQESPTTSELVAGVKQDGSDATSCEVPPSSAPSKIASDCRPTATADANDLTRSSSNKSPPESERGNATEVSAVRAADDAFEEAAVPIVTASVPTSPSPKAALSSVLLESEHVPEPAHLPKSSSGSPFREENSTISEKQDAGAVAELVLGDSREACSDTVHDPKTPLFASVSATDVDQSGDHGSETTKSSDVPVEKADDDSVSQNSQPTLAKEALSSSSKAAEAAQGEKTMSERLPDHRHDVNREAASAISADTVSNAACSPSSDTPMSADAPSLPVDVTPDEARVTVTSNSNSSSGSHKGSEAASSVLCPQPASAPGKREEPSRPASASLSDETVPAILEEADATTPDTLVLDDVKNASNQPMGKAEPAQFSAASETTCEATGSTSTPPVIDFDAFSSSQFEGAKEAITALGPASKPSSVPLTPQSATEPKVPESLQSLEERGDDSLSTTSSTDPYAATMGQTAGRDALDRIEALKPGDPCLSLRDLNIPQDALPEIVSSLWTRDLPALVDVSGNVDSGHELLVALLNAIAEKNSTEPEPVLKGQNQPSTKDRASGKSLHRHIIAANACAIQHVSVDLPSTPTALYLTHNQLTDLPHLTDQNFLEVLVLSCNEIIALSPPSHSGSLRNLQALHLDRNSISDVSPEVFASLSKLRILDLSRNCLLSVPEGLDSLAALEQLSLAGNLISDFPHALPRTLKTLDLSDNDLRQVDERCIPGLPAKLSQLSLDGNSGLCSVSDSARERLLDLETFSADGCPAFCLTPVRRRPVSMVDDADRQMRDLVNSKKALMASIAALRVTAKAEKARSSALERQLHQTTLRLERVANELQVARHQMLPSQGVEDELFSSSISPASIESLLPNRSSAPRVAEGPTAQGGGSTTPVSAARDGSSSVLASIEADRVRLSQEREALERINESREQQIARLEQDKSELCTKFDDLKRRYDASSKKIRKCESQIESLQEVLTEREKELQDTNAALSDLEQKFGEKTILLAASESKVEELDSACAKHSSALKEMKEVSEALDRELTSTRQRVRERETLLDEARRAEQTCREETRELRSQLAVETSRISNSTTIADRYGAELQAERNLRLRAAADVEVLRGELMEANEARSASANEVATLQSKIDGLENRRTKLDQETVRLRENQSELEGELAKAHRARSSDAEKIRSLQEDLQASSEAADHVARLREKISALEELLAVAQSTAATEALASAGSSLDREPSKSKGQQQQGHAEQGKTQPSSSKVVAELRAAKAQAKNLEATLSDNKDELARIKGACDGLEFERDKAIAESQELRGALDHADDDIRDARQRMDSAVAEAGELKEGLAELSARYAELEKRFETSMAAADQAAYEVKVREKTQHALEDKIAAMEATSAQCQEELLGTKSLLVFAQDEISRLEGERTELLSSASLARSVHVDGSSSVSSDRSEAGASYSLFRIQELESYVASVKADCAQRSMEVQRLSTALQEKDDTVKSLNQQITSVRDDARGLANELTVSGDQQRELEKRLVEVQGQLRQKISESSDRANTIENHLMPALEAAKAEARTRSGELSARTVEIAELRATADKTRSLLEQEIAATSARLESTSADLAATSEALADRNGKVADMETSLELMHQRAAAQEVRLEELEDDLSHRRSALVVIQDRLRVVEAEKAQRDDSAETCRSELISCRAELAVVRDRAQTAEFRARRHEEEAVVLQDRLETAEARSDSRELSARIRARELDTCKRQLADLEAAMTAKENAFIEQSALSSKREREFNEAVDKMQSTILAREAEIGVLKTELAASQRQVASLTQTLSATRQELATTQSDLSERSAELDDARSSIKDREKKLEEREETIASLESTVSDRKDDITARDRRIATQLATIADQDGRIAGMKAEKTASERLVESLHGEISSQQSELISRDSRINDLERTKCRLENDLRGLNDDLEAQRNAFGSLETSKAAIEESLSRTQQALAQSRQRYEQERTEKEHLSHTVDRCKKELNVLESHTEGHDTIVREYRDTQRALTEKTVAFEEASRRARELTSEVASLTEKVDNKSSMVEQYSARIGALTAEARRLQTNLDAAQEQLASAQSHVETTQKKNREVQASSTASLRELQVQLDAATAEYEQKYALHSRELSQARESNDSTVRQLRQLEADLVVKSEVANRLDMDLQSAQEAMQRQHQTIEQLRREVTKSEAAIALGNRASKGLSDEAMGHLSAELTSRLDSKEKAIANLHSWCCFINKKLHAAERELANKHAHETGGAACDDSARSEKGGHADQLNSSSKKEVETLREQARRAEEALAAAKDSESALQRRLAGVELAAKSADEAQRAADALRVQLEVSEREYQQRIDRMMVELDHCRADREAAERECAQTIGDNAALRERVLDLESGRESMSTRTSRASLSSVDAGLTRVTFVLEGFTDMNASVGVVGNDPMLGNWDADRRQPMTAASDRSGKVVRRCQALVSPSTELQYKYVVVGPAGGVVWEGGENRVLEVDESGSRVEVRDNWSADAHP